MEYTRLGASGLKVSRIGLGMMGYGLPQWRRWVLDEEQARPIVRQAADSGIIFFDTADSYSSGVSEEITGRILRECFSHRDDFVLATKVYAPTGPGPNDRGLSRKHILAAAEASLRRLGTDYIDLYQVHRWDAGSPVDEMLAALDALVTAGKVRYLGASGMFAWQLAKAVGAAERHGWTQFISMQAHYNLICRDEERETIPCCQDLGIGFLPWSPLARGLLAGTRNGPSAARSRRAHSDELTARIYAGYDLTVLGAVEEIAASLGIAPAQVALAWLLGRPGVTAPLIGASAPAHVDEAVAALSIALAEPDRGRLEPSPS